MSDRRVTINREIAANSRLGFIGLGFLGSRIAQRLVAVGFPMMVHDRDQEKTKDLAALGAVVAPNAEALAEDVDVVLSCLPSDAAVQAVYLGAGKVLESARPGARIIELSTIAPETSRQVHDAAAKFDIAMLDVAVSGSTAAAEVGALTLFGGGARRVFEAVQPIFAPIAKQWFYMGPSGAGVAMKLVVNTLLGLGMQSIAEAVALGDGLGLPRDLLLDTLAKTAVVAPAHAGKLATAKRNDYAPQFPIRLMNKDFALILTAAAQCGLSMPATEAAAVVNSAEAENTGEEDFSAVIRRMEQQVAEGDVLPPVA
jgi:3-hydroxyisobutyrate dehydrogenase-like beta-hydroxyacid dehydrogenase